MSDTREPTGGPGAERPTDASGRSRTSRFPLARSARVRWRPRRSRPGQEPSTTGLAARRDRHGRGPRTPLLPAGLPGSRTRAQQFDEAVLEAVADLEGRWPGQLDALEFAVDEVPTVPGDGPEPPADDVVVDVGVPLCRFLPAGVDHRGRPTKARLVVYRRPLEARSVDSGDLVDLITEVLVEQLESVLGPEEPGPDDV